MADGYTVQNEISTILVKKILANEGLNQPELLRDFIRHKYRTYSKPANSDRVALQGYINALEKAGWIKKIKEYRNSLSIDWQKIKHKFYKYLEKNKLEICEMKNGHLASITRKERQSDLLKLNKRLKKLGRRHLTVKQCKDLFQRRPQTAVFDKEKHDKIVLGFIQDCLQNLDTNNPLEFNRVFSSRVNPILESNIPGILGYTLFWPIKKDSKYFFTQNILSKYGLD